MYASSVTLSLLMFVGRVGDAVSRSTETIQLHAHRFRGFPTVNIFFLFIFFNAPYIFLVFECVSVLPQSDALRVHAA